MSTAQQQQNAINSPYFKEKSARHTRFGGYYRRSLSFKSHDPRPPTPFFGPCPSRGRGFIICTLISNLESLEMERADIVREISDNLVIARAKGFNIGAIRKILAERRRDKGELEEERAVIELYKSFLGM
jgi:uncharacterized protein (UPF0335 family)